MMRGRITTMVGAGVVAVAFLAGCKPQGVIVVSPQRHSEPVQVLRHYDGNDPGLKEPMLLLINSAEELESIGSFDLKNRAIDFDRESLVLLALGEKPTGGYWARITGVQLKNGLLYVQGLASRPGEDQAVTQVLTYPYDAAVITKVRKAQLRSEIESLVGKHPQEYRTK